MERKNFFELTKEVEFKENQERFVFKLCKLGKADREKYRAKYYTEINYYDYYSNKSKACYMLFYSDDGLDDYDYIEADAFKDVDNNTIAILEDIYKECIKELKRIDKKELDIVKKCMYDEFLRESILFFEDKFMEKSKKDERAKYGINYSVITRKFRYKKLLKCLGIDTMPTTRVDFEKAIIQYIDEKTGHVIPKEWYQVSTYRELVIQPDRKPIYAEINGNIQDYIAYVNKSKKYYSQVEGTDSINYCVLRAKSIGKKNSRLLCSTNLHDDSNCDYLFMFVDSASYKDGMIKLHKIINNIHEIRANNGKEEWKRNKLVTIENVYIPEVY